MENPILQKLSGVRTVHLIRDRASGFCYFNDPVFSIMTLLDAGLWAAVEQLLELCDHNVVLGGGGYNPWTVVRCWSGLWGRLSHREMPGLLPPDAQAFLRGLECDLVDEEDVRPQWTTTLADEPNSGPVREEVKDLVTKVIH